MRIHILLILSICIVVLMLGSTKGFAQKAALPFSINQRPQPSGSNLETLIPRIVGSFRRDAISGNTDPFSGEDVNVEYKSEKDIVFFGFGITQTFEDASEAVKLTREEAINSKINIKGQQYQTGKNPSYFKIAGFMSWTRGKYFFYAKARNEQVLKNFMEAFPF
jgi:hypothetical protein